jgi:hypothetical protein
MVNKIPPLQSIASYAGGVSGTSQGITITMADQTQGESQSSLPGRWREIILNGRFHGCCRTAWCGPSFDISG